MICELLIAANKQEHNDTTMTSRTTRQNAISWQQFAERERDQRNNLTAQQTKQPATKEADYDEVPTPRSERYSRWTAAKTASSEVKQTIRKCVVKTIAASASASKKKANQTIATTTTDSARKNEIEVPTQVRTRAQRRAAAATEPEVVVPQPNPEPKRKERRTDHWVTRDDKRRQSARLLKLKHNQQLGSE